MSSRSCTARVDMNFMLRMHLVVVIREAARAAMGAVRHPMSQVTRDLRTGTPKLRGNVKGREIERSTLSSSRQLLNARVPGLWTCTHPLLTALRGRCASTFEGSAYRVEMSLAVAVVRFAPDCGLMLSGRLLRWTGWLARAASHLARMRS